jgi:hypothetical protein
MTLDEITYASEKNDKSAGAFLLSEVHKLLQYTFGGLIL